ncbi:MAG: F-type H+-transporting ATPase subunit delta [Actinomycetota bacterium]|jgi:F-type H+-transporting ATPase subunit delta|nr:F-type H+-transporting ATPase subunit delta [Actinomycetota bacterium]
MASEDEIIRGYAEALFRVSQAEGELETVEDELYRFGKLLEENYELKRALSEQNVDHAGRVKILEELLGDKVSPHTLGMLTFIVAQDRARQLPEILEELARIAAESRDLALAEVRSAVPLDDEQRKELTRALERATGKRIELKVLIDPDVLGGLVAKVGDTVIDGTVRHRIEQLKEQVRA